jgi:hypothetical protein
MPIAFKHVLLAQQDDDEDDDKYEDDEELVEEQYAATAAAAGATVNALPHQQQPDPALLQAPLAMTSAQEAALQSVVEDDEQARKRQRVEAQGACAVQMFAGGSEQPQVSSTGDNSTAAFSIGQNGHATAPVPLTGVSCFSNTITICGSPSSPLLPVLNFAHELAMLVLTHMWHALT